MPTTVIAHVRRILLIGGLVGLLAACEAGATPATPPVVAGASDRPREVNIVAKDYTFLPDVVDLVPGETVLLHVINGGLAVHDVVIGDAAVHAAWEAAEAATEGAPPGPTPLVSVPPEVSGIRLVVASGERVDLVWTVPAEAADDPGWQVGCHIPGHWERGMQVPVRWIASATGRASGRYALATRLVNTLGGTFTTRAGTGRVDVGFESSKEVPGWHM